MLACILQPSLQACPCLVASYCRSTLPVHTACPCSLPCLLLCASCSSWHCCSMCTCGSSSASQQPPWATQGLRVRSVGGPPALTRVKGGVQPLTEPFARIFDPAHSSCIITDSSGAPLPLSVLEAAWAAGDISHVHLPQHVGESPGPSSRGASGLAPSLPTASSSIAARSRAAVSGPQPPPYASTGVPHQTPSLFLLPSVTMDGFVFAANCPLLPLCAGAEAAWQWMVLN